MRLLLKSYIDRNILLTNIHKKVIIRHSRLIEKHTKTIIKNAKLIAKNSKTAVHFTIEISLAYLVFVVGGSLNLGMVNVSDSGINAFDVSTWANGKVEDFFAVILTAYFVHYFIHEITLLIREGKSALDMGTIYIVLGTITTVSFLLGAHFQVNIIPQWVLNWEYDITLFAGAIIVIAFKRAVQLLNENIELLKSDKKLLKKDYDMLQEEFDELKASITAN